MGQELLNSRGYVKNRTKYYLATSSTGLRAVRGSTNKHYTHACIATSRSDWGWVTSLWSSRADLAKRNANSYNKHYDGKTMFEVVETQEITPKEARLIKREINLECENHKLDTMQEALQQSTSN